MYLLNSDIRQKVDTLAIWLRQAAKNNNIWHTQCLKFFFFQKTLGSYAKYYQHVKSFHFINLKFV